WPRDVLDDEAHDEVVREGVTPEGLQLRLAFERDDDSAGSLAVDGRSGGRYRSREDAASTLVRDEIGGHCARTIGVEAGFRYCAPGVHAAADLEARAEPRVDADVEEVIDELLFPEIRRLR